MTGAERRAAILRALDEAGAARPISGEALGARLGVSRQVIVQDIALLRAEGHAVVSTNRGYALTPAAAPATSAAPVCRLVKVRHTIDQIAEELDLIVDRGGRVEDIMVNHRTYGLVRAPLNVKSRRDVRHFLDDLAAGISSPLLTLTDGYHFHHVSADTPEELDEIVAALGAHGMLARLTDYERERMASGDGEACDDLDADARDADDADDARDARDADDARDARPASACDADDPPTRPL